MPQKSSPDLSKLSDTDLEHLATGNLSKMSDEALAHIAGEKPEPSLGQKALMVAGAVGKKVDQYTGAPSRAAIGALQSGGNPVSAFAKQFGEDPDRAPSGEDIAASAGLSRQQLPSSIAGKAGRVPGAFSPAGFVGGGIEMAATPLNFTGPAFAGLRAAGKGAAAVLDVAKGGYISQKAIQAGEALASGAGRVATKTAEVMTGVPEQEIKTYVTQSNEINQMMKQAGGSVPEAADAIRKGFQDKIAATRKSLGGQINASLERLGSEKTIPVQSVIDQLGAVQARLNPSLHVEEMAQIDSLAKRIENVADANGKVSPSELHQITQFLQEKARPAYTPDGQIFAGGKQTQLAAKAAAAESRQILNAAVPEVAKANTQLSKLHQIEDKMNPNLIAPGKPDAALSAAGSAQNPRNVAYLQKLGDLTGTDMVADAQKFAAAKTFGNPAWSPKDATGKSVYRVGAGAAIGGTVAHAVGLPATLGAAVGAAMTSPAALKAAIDTGKIPMQAFSALASGATKVTPDSLAKAWAALQTSQGARLLQHYTTEPIRAPADGPTGTNGAMERKLKSLGK